MNTSRRKLAGNRYNVPPSRGLAPKKPALAHKILGLADKAANRWFVYSLGRAKPQSDTLHQDLSQLAEHYASAEMLGADSPLYAAPRFDKPVVNVVRQGFANVRFTSSFTPTWKPYIEPYCASPENLRVNVKWLITDKTAPTAIILHGWRVAHPQINERLFATNQLLARRWNVAFVELPFHGQRQSPDALQKVSFPSINIVRTNEGFGQIISDLRQIAHFLRLQGSRAVGVMGISLGAYIASLWASLDALDFVVAITPAVSLAPTMWEMSRHSETFRIAQSRGLDAQTLSQLFAVHCPLTRPSQTDKQKQLIVAANVDHVTPGQHAVDLWEHWQKPELHWIRGGHVANSLHLGDREFLLRWLSQVNS